LIYVTSDLHGYPLEKFKELLKKINFSDNDFLYILGDVIDRGKDGIRILRWLMSQPNIQLILGNHESMMLDCDFLFDEITDESIYRLTGSKLNIFSTWMANSGNVTLEALRATRNSEIEYIFEYLQDAPLYETLTVNDRDFILVHSGFKSFSKDKKLSEYTADDLLWARPSIDEKYFDNITTVFGHTPTVIFGEQFKGRAVATDTWIDIDAGAAYGMNPMFLRLDDMKEFYFD